MVNYKARLQLALTRSGRTRQELADRLKVSYQAVRKALTGETGSFSAKNNEAAAAYLGVSSKWLATGVGSPEISHENVSNVRSAVTVPLITWQVLLESGENLQNKDFTPSSCERIATFGEAQRPAAFALGVVGDPMVSTVPGEASFPEGTIIIVDPDEKASAGDFVLAKDPTSHAPTFKRLVHDGGRWFLRPLNPAYPTTELPDRDAAIIGRVIEYQLRRKL